MELACTIKHQVPPDTDPRSPYRRRRVDFTVDFFDENQSNRQFTLLFVEVKGAHVAASEYETVEGQVFDASETYGRSLSTHSNVVFAMTAVGTKWRLFKWAEDFQPIMQRYTSETDLREYQDAANPEASLTFLNLLRRMLQLVPAKLAGKDYLKPNVPPPAQPSASVLSQPRMPSQQVVGSQTQYSRAPLAQRPTVVPSSSAAASSSRPAQQASTSQAPQYIERYGYKFTPDGKHIYSPKYNTWLPIKKDNDGQLIAAIGGAWAKLTLDGDEDFTYVDGTGTIQEI
ncbi:hypothetical protein Tdes44962_MAKER03034 [Teratosphaeria destructans]|uniref:Uncharacterized protein n=1 Tax=Teratosphaeria destructans TaxID=418781 RepID=A0A9W7SRF7_9PEZI|nr:hypothetical protein Tdes44962_MAKER03034 [Teratosphaeria destructans]